MDIKLAKIILSNYAIKGRLTDVSTFGEGHINGTYLVTTNNGNKKERYILQLINDKIFHPVNKLMDNYVLVTNHLKNEIKKYGGDPNRETLTVIFTKNKKSFVEYKGQFYRLLTFIDNTTALQVVTCPLDFFYSALAFGNFYKMLDKFNANKLYEIIPNFHNTKKRYADFLKAVKEDKLGRAKTCKKEIKFINDHKKYYGILVDLLKAKKLPLRVTHNDTKLNNVLFDNKTGRPIAVIDLDTIMPGSLCYDFGDAIRFGCNSAAEDEKDLKKVYFRYDLYVSYLNGFLYALGDKITKEEKKQLANASIIMTMECGMRFLADYLEGDHYFHTKYPTHNLVRCRTQLKLVEGMEKSYKLMQSAVK